MKKIVRSARTFAHGLLALSLLVSSQRALAQGAGNAPPAAVPAAPPSTAPAPAPSTQAPPPASTQAPPPAPQAPYAQPPYAPYGGGYPPPPPGAYQTYPPPTSAQGVPAPYYQPRPLYQPGYGGYARPPRPRKGMMIAGLAIFGGAYLLSTSIAAALFEDDDERDYNYDRCESCNRVAPWLFLPVFGPFVAMSKTHDSAGDWGLWMLGMVQVVGAALTIGGAVRYRNTKREAERQFASWKLGDDRRLTLGLSASPRATGPNLRIDF